MTESGTGGLGGGGNGQDAAADSLAGTVQGAASVASRTSDGDGRDDRSLVHGGFGAGGGGGAAAAAAAAARVANCAAPLFGERPLHLAAYRGELPVIELLLEAGADPNATDKVAWSVCGVVCVCVCLEVPLKARVLVCLPAALGA